MVGFTFGFGVTFGSGKGTLFVLGFGGISNTYRAVIPFKKPPNGELQPNEVAENERISKHRVVIENFYGRMVKKCKNIDIKTHMTKKNSISCLS